MKIFVLPSKIFFITSFPFVSRSRSTCQNNDSHNNPKTKDSKYNDTVAHSLSLVRVLFEDFGVAISIHGNAKDIHNTHPILPLILLNDGFKFEKGIIADTEYNRLEKECLKSFELIHCVYLVTMNTRKICCASWWNFITVYLVRPPLSQDL